MRENTGTKLTSAAYSVVDVIKKTKAKFWSELKAGDVIEFTNEIKLC